jgi:hypothetical protein
MKITTTTKNNNKIKIIFLKYCSIASNFFNYKKDHLKENCLNVKILKYLVKRMPT